MARHEPSRWSLSAHDGVTSERNIASSTHQEDDMIQTLKRIFIYGVLTAFSFIGFTQTVQAAIIGTEQIHAANNAEQSRAKIAAALARPDVAAQLEKMGVKPADAQQRVAALTDAEAAKLAGQVDTLPAGGDGIIGALLLIFFVLLVTDILGLTKVFPFTHKAR
jgi:hypothetical protein